MFPTSNTYQFFNAAAANGTVTIDTVNFSTALIHVYSAAGSTATVTITTGSAAGSPSVTVATISNPDATGQMWVGTPGQSITVAISGYSAGSITVNSVLR